MESITEPARLDSRHVEAQMKRKRKGTGKEIEKENKWKGTWTLKGNGGNRKDIGRKWMFEKEMERQWKGHGKERARLCLAVLGSLLIKFV